MYTSRVWKSSVANGIFWIINIMVHEKAAGKTGNCDVYHSVFWCRTSGDRKWRKLEHRIVKEETVVYKTMRLLRFFRLNKYAIAEASHGFFVTPCLFSSTNRVTNIMDKLLMIAWIETYKDLRTIFDNVVISMHKYTSIKCIYIFETISLYAHSEKRIHVFVCVCVSLSWNSEQNVTSKKSCLNPVSRQKRKNCSKNSNFYNVKILQEACIVVLYV